ncbi:hypothetical protein D9756_007326 [Leucocoprinus leucothites]|uniref:Uncharacterized protein n=1 Tax=Leucocoprinus leucothites TaxID=201217 RepID=A0A8H5FZC8_9AGAR|nr:hypothetical protein D9756_007326 [Leucoagaricus leucothites]
MHSVLRFGGIFTLALLAMASAIPTIEVRGTSDMTKRDAFSGSQVSSRSPGLETRHLNDGFGISRREVNSLERRQAADIAKSVAELIDSILNGVKHDNEVFSIPFTLSEHGQRPTFFQLYCREKFTKDTVAKGREQFPDFNWVACHVDSEQDFDGEEGKDWGHQHKEFDLESSGTVGYEIYWLRSGTFKRKGDGGYINWAWQGAISGTDDDGATVHFVAPT